MTATARTAAVLIPAPHTTTVHARDGRSSTGRPQRPPQTAGP